MSNVVTISHCLIMSRTYKWHELHDNEYFRECHKSAYTIDMAAILADLPECCSISILPVTNNIYRSTVPAPNYLPEWHSTVFWHHWYTGSKS